MPKLILPVQERSWECLAWSNHEVGARGPGVWRDQNCLCPGRGGEGDEMVGNDGLMDQNPPPFPYSTLRPEPPSARKVPEGQVWSQSSPREVSPLLCDRSWHME